MDKEKDGAACENCRFWRMLVDRDTGEPQSTTYGVCRRFPPVWVAPEGEFTQAESYAEDWCGEYQPSEGRKRART